jgi:hypothetical protein
VPKAQVHVLDVGHFASDTAADEIAAVSEALSVLHVEGCQFQQGKVVSYAI